MNKWEPTSLLISAKAGNDIKEGTRELMAARGTRGGERVAGDHIFCRRFARDEGVIFGAEAGDFEGVAKGIGGAA